jgi:hypothetical protein
LKVAEAVPEEVNQMLGASAPVALTRDICGSLRLLPYERPYPRYPFLQSLAMGHIIPEGKMLEKGKSELRRRLKMVTTTALALTSTGR